MIDLVLIQKNANGIHQALEMNQVGPDLIGVFDPLKVEVSGMVQIDDIQIGSPKRWMMAPMSPS